MKATEIMKLVELLSASTKKEDKPMRRQRPPRFIHKMKDEDVLALMHKRLEEAQALDNFLKEREKLNKKEEKHKKDGPSVQELALFLVATYPIIGLLMYVLLYKR